MKRLLVAALISMVLGDVSAQDLTSCTHSQFVRIADYYVSEGSRQYDRSYRTGIKLYADSLERALQIRSGAGRLTVNDSLLYSACLLKLRADWHYENGNYDSKSYVQSEQLFLESLSVYASHPYLTSWPHGAHMIQREMAQLMYKLKRYDEALKYTDDAYNAYINALNRGDFVEDDPDYETLLQIQSQKAMCMARVGDTQGAQMLINELLGRYPRGSADYYELLRKKGKILMLSRSANGEKEALMLYRQYFAQKKSEVLKTFATMTSSQREDYWMRIRPFFADCYQLEDADPGFLYDVTLFSKALLLHLNRMTVLSASGLERQYSVKYTWNRVQTRLPKQSCAIEFVQYEKHGKQLMAAIVLQKSGTPRWVQMMAPDDFMEYKIWARTNEERLYSTDGKVKNSMYTDSTLCAALWNPELCQAVGSARRVYFAPDGYLHQLAIEYMLPGAIADREVYRLSSTRTLLQDGRVRTDAALVLGGVRYDAKGVAAGEGNDTVAYSYIQHRNAKFNFLPGSLHECNAIYGLRSCPHDTLLAGKDATELAFRSLCNSYPVLNISTHGYFGSAQVPQGTDIKTAMSDETLSQSVIAMAGANSNISDFDYNASRMDGLLSARELSETDMSNVDLAVISACQSGLGYVTSDGVFGIQRGLKNAGVKSLLLSLWNVDDEATSLLMSCFHKNLQDGMSVHEAFMSARKSLILLADRQSASLKPFNPGTLTVQVSGGKSKYKLPQCCDAFILIDAID